jgi:hypothetical protein
LEKKGGELKKSIYPEKILKIGFLQITEFQWGYDEKGLFFIWGEIL